MLVRRIQRHPARTLLMIVTLALGLGATTAVVSAIRGVLLAPLAFPRPDRLVTVQERDEGDGFGTTGFSTYADWRESLRSFASLTAIASRSYTLTTGGEPEQLPILGMTPDAFATFGIRPILGRAFTPADDVRTAPRVVLLSHELWSRRFGGDESILGRTIRMSDTDFEVIGVMPPKTRMTPDEWRTERVDAWVPLRYNPSLEWACRSCRHLRVFGRLRDGVSAEQAAREAETFTATLRRAYRDQYPTHGWVAVESLQNVIVGRQVASSLWMILGVAGLVLIAAIANAGSLGLAELFVRHNELAVRQSLGATPLRIAMMLVLESMAQALAASIAGVGLAYAAVAWLRVNANAFIPRAADLAIDPLVVAICASIALLSGAVIGVLPALRARKWSLVTNNRGIVSGRSSAQQVLVGMNIALSVVLLAGSTLILRSVRNLFATPAGFEAKNAIAFRMAVEDQEPGAVYDRFLAEARHLPGVESIALTSQLPFAEDQDNAGIAAEGVEQKAGDAPNAQRFAITPAYFSTLRIPLRAGRAFDATDTAKSEPVIIINETAARMLWSDGNALGKRMRLGGGADAPWRRVIAIAGNVAPGDLGAKPIAQAYLPMTQFGPPSEVTMVARTTTGAAPLRALLRKLAPTAPVYRVAALRELIARSEARRQFVLALLTAFSTVVLALAMIGVYGILALFVSSRRRELALRIALGASALGMFRHVLTQGLRLAGIGIVAGVAASLVLGRFLSSMLYGVRNGDPASLLTVVAMLAIATALACVLPAWRAARVAPEAALRED
jgi:predicted permease